MTIFTSLRGKLLTAFLLLSLVPVIAIAIHGQFFTRAALSDQVLEQSTYQVGLQAENLVASLQQVHGDALYVSSLRSLRQMVDSSTSEAAVWMVEATQDLLVFASVRPMYHGVKYLDATGREVVAVRSDGRTVSASPLQDRSTSRYVQQALHLAPGGVFVSSFALDQDMSDEGAPYIHYLMKMAGGGLVQIDLHAGWLLRHLPKNPGRDLWALLDQDGRWLVYPANFDPAASAVDVSPLITGSSGHHDAPASVFFFNTIYPVANNPASYWVIVRETPKDELFAGLSYFHGLAMLFIGGATILAVVLAALTSRWTVGPIVRLKNMAVAFGQTGQPPDVPARLPADEIGELTRSFCDMAQELERKRQQEHRLIEQLIRAQEEERKLVAFDLHDGLIQQMVGARFYLTNCREHCPVEAHDARSGILRGCEALTEAIVEGRRIIEGLRPVVLDDLGLTAAIEELAEQSARAAGWSLTLNLQPLPTEPEKTVAVTLFRIAQEAFNNIRKHAQAQHVTVTLHNGDGIDLTIADDGVGFDPERVSTEAHGLGVTTMHERAALINGQCAIDSRPQAGTRVHVWVPGTVHVPLSAIPGGQTAPA